MEATSQQTKDFMASFFPPDMDHPQGTQDNTQFQYQQTPSSDLSIGNLINVGDPSAAYNPAALLEQQYKLSQLQQLQQLQNQIFQQQIALISGSQQSPLPLEPEQRERVGPFHGLPTPGNSTELRATPSVEYVSPMILDYNDTFSQHYAPPRGSTSAPAHIAFQTTSNELDFDISPLTSPWLGAHQQSASQSRPSAKRNAASSSDEDAATSSARPSRKKQSPAVRASVPIPPKRSSNSRSKSANSTPMLRSTRARKASINVPGDTPSPVDLSMPPPAPPAEPSSLTQSSPGLGPQLKPVTPASIMNLGRLGITTTIKPSTKKSPSLKAILPGAVASSSRQQAQIPPKKTSHKAAEQKRRDSLKTTFDELRTLLPPIPLPHEVNADEPVLPGALPPRGPPKAGGEGPNKGVSKLQLLMCGNDYIRQLHGRVYRRDDEIGRLRREVARLRSAVRGEMVGLEEEEPVDLERDLDEVEAGSMLGRAMMDDDGEEDD
ncbi:hypothetical protein C8F01DRAFT_1129151 [Mycena amicta]|nr:hypothetical protein C8F01DRAFT_1129151 [Mycena amicta]